MLINELFKDGIDCCGKVYPYPIEIVIYNILETLMPCMDEKVNKAVSREVYGFDSETSYDEIMNMLYISTIFIFAWHDLHISGNNNITQEDIENIKKKYNFECIENYLECSGCDIKVVYKLKKLMKLLISNKYKDGIGAMQIKGYSEGQEPYFRIRN